MYTLQDFADGVQMFNRVAGKSVPKTRQQLIDQINLIREELNETEDAIRALDDVEALDGVVDVLYTAIGLSRMFDELGFDIEAAAEVTDMNNQTKFPIEEAVAAETVKLLKESNLEYSSFEYKYNPVYEVYVITNQDGKVMKPVGYVKNNVADFAVVGALAKLKEN